MSAAWNRARGPRRCPGTLGRREGPRALSDAVLKAPARGPASVRSPTCCFPLMTLPDWACGGLPRAALALAWQMGTLSHSPWLASLRVGDSTVVPSWAVEPGSLGLSSASRPGVRLGRDSGVPCLSFPPASLGGFRSHSTEGSETLLS